MRVIEPLLRHDRWLAIGGLLFVALLAWAYIFVGAGMDMSAMAGMEDMVMPMAWSSGHAVTIFLMWWIMMVAMMLPSASPTILIYARISSRQRELGKPFVPAGLFAAGYLAIWGAFSLAATSLQWGLESTGLLTMAMASASTVLSGIVLVAAGLWQLTPLKRACLRHCRSPLHFLTHRFRTGTLGALRMGAEHGLYCLGCCWFLMALLFYGGVMNLYWIAGLAIYVLIEKLAPAGDWIGRIAGVALTVAGGWLLATTIV